MDVGLAECFGVSPEYTPTVAKDATRRMIATVECALAVDQSLAEARAPLAATKDREWNWSGAEHEHQRAIQLDRDNPRSHVLYAIHLEFLGRMPEVYDQLHRGIELDR